MRIKNINLLWALSRPLRSFLHFYKSIMNDLTISIGYRKRHVMYLKSFIFYYITLHTLITRQLLRWFAEYVTGIYSPLSRRMKPLSCVGLKNDFPQYTHNFLRYFELAVNLRTNARRLVSSRSTWIHNLLPSKIGQIHPVLCTIRGAVSMLLNIV